MDYREQRKFLLRQRWRLVPAALGCAALLGEAVRGPAPLAARIAGAALAFGLLWAAYYLPNYLGMDAASIRRPRWVVRARWFLLALTMVIVATSVRSGQVKQTGAALAMVVAAAVLHLALLRLLRRALPLDLREPDPPRLAALAVVYAAMDFTLFWATAGVGAGLQRRGGVPSVLLVELLLAFAFLALVLLRPRPLAAQMFFGAAIGGLSYLFAPGPLLAAAAFLWAAGVAHLYARAVKQNLANFNDLADHLSGFCRESREAVVRMMPESGLQLADDWRHSNPQGQAEVAAWYSRNARLYLFNNCQHHLLYKHIVYTLGLLRLARGRVLDFGGGPGDFSRALARADADTTFLDVPGESADYLRWRAEREGLPVRIVHELEQLEGPYDVIYALDVVEHLVDLEPVFACWHALLRPDGLLVATYYNGPNSSAPMHINPGYDAREYLLAHGFRDVKQRYVGLFSSELMRKNHFLILERQV